MQVLNDIALQSHVAQRKIYQAFWVAPPMNLQADSNIYRWVNLHIHHLYVMIGTLEVKSTTKRHVRRNCWLQTLTKAIAFIEKHPLKKKYHVNLRGPLQCPPPRTNALLGLLTIGGSP